MATTESRMPLACAAAQTKTARPAHPAGRCAAWLLAILGVLAGLSVVGVVAPQALAAVAIMVPGSLAYGVALAVTKRQFVQRLRLRMQIAQPCTAKIERVSMIVVASLAMGSIAACMVALLYPVLPEGWHRGGPVFMAAIIGLTGHWAVGTALGKLILLNTALALLAVLGTVWFWV